MSGLCNPEETDEQLDESAHLCAGWRQVKDRQTVLSQIPLSRTQALVEWQHSAVIILEWTVPQGKCQRTQRGCSS